MAAPTKLGTKWIHRVQVNGKRTSGTFDTKAAALVWEAEQRVATPKGKLGLTKTCADAFEKYELEVSKPARLVRQGWLCEYEIEEPEDDRRRRKNDDLRSGVTFGVTEFREPMAL
jgi:hypothetical protein